MDNIDTFESPLLADVQINQDGTLKQSGKQNVKFRNVKRLNFKARPLYMKHDDGTIAYHDNGKPVRVMDEKGKPAFDIDPRTGIPFKDAYEEIVEMCRVETKGDTNIVDDIASPMLKRQFNRQYKYFRSGKIPDGASIEDFEFLQPQTITELHMYGIHTLEQVSEMEDVDCEQIRDQSGFEIRDIAKQWLKINSPQGQAGKADRMELENARIKLELADLKAQVKGVKNRAFVAQEVTQVEEAPETATMEITPDQLKNRIGRPRKV